jgi:hypothetical protein
MTMTEIDKEFDGKWILVSRKDVNKRQGGGGYLYAAATNVNSLQKVKIYIMRYFT